MTSCFYRQLIWKIAAHTRLQSLVSLQHSKHIHPHVSQEVALRYCYVEKSELISHVSYPGLQTPRLKRLAEIVSAQAIAQQEKLEVGEVDGFDGHQQLAEVEESETEQ